MTQTRKFCVVTLKQGKQKSILAHHPWIMSGAVGSVQGNPAPGDIVEVQDATKLRLGWGHFSPHSQIRVRVLVFGDLPFPDDEWFYRMVESAIRRRFPAEIPQDRSANRLIFSESDFIPGLIVDRYANYLVVQSSSVGIEKIKPFLTGILAELIQPSGILERNDVVSRKLEGMDTTESLLWGKLPEDNLEIEENGYLFSVNLKKGQKTGFYLDQKDNRMKVARYAAGKNVLDVCSYTGAFSVYALGAGAAHAEQIDVSENALLTASHNIARNIPDSVNRNSHRKGNAFQVLRQLKDERKSFSMIILDPPKLAPAKRFLKTASKAYKDINLQALQLIEPEGILATFSCSGALSADYFQEILWWAGKDSGREIQILEQLRQGSDHPVRVTCPESFYLKGFLCRII